MESDFALLQSIKEHLPQALCEETYEDGRDNMQVIKPPRETMFKRNSHSSHNLLRKAQQV